MLLDNDPERKLEERRKAREASRADRAGEAHMHTTAAAASDVSSARQARLDRLAAERMAEANTKREQQNSLLEHGERRAQTLPDESVQDPGNVEEDELIPAADRTTGEVAQAMQLQKEVDEMAHMLSVRDRKQSQHKTSMNICCVALSQQFVLSLICFCNRV
eukprot:COSAG02_NODE_498_length_21087_cov_33.272394_4_plen_162_part_00